MTTVFMGLNPETVGIIFEFLCLEQGNETATLMAVSKSFRGVLVSPAASKIWSSFELHAYPHSPRLRSKNTYFITPELFQNVSMHSKLQTLQLTTSATSFVDMLSAILFSRDIIHQIAINIEFSNSFSSQDLVELTHSCGVILSALLAGPGQILFPKLTALTISSNGSKKSIAHEECLHTIQHLMLKLAGRTLRSLELCPASDNLMGNSNYSKKLAIWCPHLNDLSIYSYLDLIQCHNIRSTSVTQFHFVNMNRGMQMMVAMQPDQLSLCPFEQFEFDEILEEISQHVIASTSTASPAASESISALVTTSATSSAPATAHSSTTDSVGVYLPSAHTLDIEDDWVDAWQLVDLIRLVPPTARDVTLRGPFTQSVPTALKAMSVYCPNLQSLDIRDLDMSAPEDFQPLRSAIVADFLRGCPAVKEVSIPNIALSERALRLLRSTGFNPVVEDEYQLTIKRT